MRFFTKEPASDKTNAVKIGETFEELRAEIQESQSFLKKLAGWSSNLLGAAVGLGLITVFLPIKIPLIAAGAMISLIGYGVTRLIKQSVEDGIEENQRKREALLNSAAPKAPKPQPAPTAKKDVSSAYNAEAGKLEALEKRVQQLQDEIAGKPVVLDKPKSLVSRLGFGS